MLSQHNIDKLNFNALYKCDPNVKYRGRLYENNLYHCCNWTFTVFNRGNKYFMRDTYWNSGDSLHIPLTDENIDEFTLVFDWNKVKKIRKDEILHYENYYCVPVDSGGHSYPKYYVDNVATKSKGLILDEIESEIKSLEWQLESLRDKKERIENDDYNLEWY